MTGGKEFISQTMMVQRKSPQKSTPSRRSIRILEDDAKTTPVPADSKMASQKLHLKSLAHLKRKFKPSSGLAYCSNKSSTFPVKKKTSSVIAVKRNKIKPAKKKAAEKSVRRSVRAKRVVDHGPYVTQ
mmetsp:Transcript_45720/g.73517  ORF Transcript_45720/g.73517 Transcript_45720/m.73517 type:complete len:128 (-) Transcript_45720:42-425(-)